MADKILQDYQGLSIKINGECYLFVGETLAPVDTDPSEVGGTFDSCLECALESSSSESSESFNNVSSSSSSSSDGFMPSDISNLVLWLDADDSDTITESGGFVSQWDDKSGNENHAAQGTGTDQPTYVSNALDGKYVVRFDGVSDILVVPDDDTLDGTSGLTILVMLKPTLSGDPDGIIAKRTGFGEFGEYAYGMFYWNDSYVYIDINGIGDRWDSDPQTFSSGTVYMMETVFDGSLIASQRSKLYVDGSLSKTSTETSTSIPNYSSTLTLGALNEGYSNFMQADYAEVLVYRKALTNTERQEVEGYLAWKWGQEGSLPTGHPYKSSPP